MLLCIVAFHHYLLAQTESDIRVSEGGYGLVRTNVTTTYDHTWGRLSDGFAARVSYEFMKKKHFTLSGNFKYTSVTTDFLSSDLDVSYNPQAIGLNGIHTMEQLGATATAKTTFLGKPFIGVAMLNSEWGIGGFNRVSATVMAMIMLKANRSTQFGIGILGMVNTTSSIPVFPVFIYRHRFNDKWRLNLYGGMLGVDFTPSMADLLSIGADIDVKSFYFKPHAVGLPKNCRFTQTDFRPSLKYRRRLIPNLFFDFQSGYAFNMKTRVNGVNGTKEYIILSQSPHPFVQASVSYSL